MMPDTLKGINTPALQRIAAGSVFVDENMHLWIYNGSDWLALNGTQLTSDVNQMESMMSSTKTKIDVRTKNVNSKLLFKEIDKLVSQACEEYIHTQKHSLYQLSSYQSPPEVLYYEPVGAWLDMCLEEMVVNGKLRVYEVICDHRNNTKTLNDNGIIRLKMQFRQRNCVNWTELDYTITVVDFKR